MYVGGNFLFVQCSVTSEVLMDKPKYEYIAFNNVFLDLVPKLHDLLNKKR